MTALTSVIDPDTPIAETKTVFGIFISDYSRENALARLVTNLDHRIHTKLAFCNAHTANIAWSDLEFRRLMNDFMIFADGIGVDIAARLLHGSPFQANLNGTDLVPALLKASAKPRRIAMIGGKPGIAEKAAKVLFEANRQHTCAPVMHGFSSADDIEVFLARLLSDPVDILLVAMGNPKQEEWIAANITGHHAVLVIGVGALFDFLAGEVIRAPLWVQKLRLEWVFRLLQEPRRLFRRYVLGNPLFLARVAMLKLGLIKMEPRLP
jgi:exopolysaccharide biosynthesis WecB/TagA/CpsF family protein